jgi:hypothetical protein
MHGYKNARKNINKEILPNGKKVYTRSASTYLLVEASEEALRGRAGSKPR